MAKEQDKLATCPIFSTIICPNRFESVAPSPKQDAVSPTEDANLVEDVTLREVMHLKARMKQTNQN